ncbi:hypothetical protein FKF78_16845 [Aeromonas hydrophila]|nr:hypothetical protein [Aeromonas hydrophila]
MPRYSNARADQLADFDRKAYFKAAKAYLDKLLGAENFIHEAVHYDERSVHGHFIYTPIIELEASTRRRSVVVGKTEDGKQKREVRECATKAGRALNAKKVHRTGCLDSVADHLCRGGGGTLWAAPWYRWQQGQAHRDQGVLRPATAGSGGYTGQDGAPCRAGGGAG